MFQYLLLEVGSAVYYVLFDGPHYRIRKTRISEITKRPSSRLYFDKYHYRCEDGYSFESVEALVPNFVFLTRKEAIFFVIERLRSDLEYEKNYIVNVRQRLEQLRADSWRSSSRKMERPSPYVQVQMAGQISTLAA